MLLSKLANQLVSEPTCRWIISGRSACRYCSCQKTADGVEPYGEGEITGGRLIGDDQSGATPKAIAPLINKGSFVASCMNPLFLD